MTGEERQEAKQTAAAADAPTIPTIPELTEAQKTVRQAAADDKALEDARVATAKAAEEKAVADEKAAVKAREGDDVRLLTDCGNWKPIQQDEGMWITKTRFTCTNESGRTQSVPDGIVRSTAEAAKLEKMRPKS